MNIFKKKPEPPPVAKPRTFEDKKADFETFRENLKNAYLLEMFLAALGNRDYPHMRHTDYCDYYNIIKIDEKSFICVTNCLYVFFVDNVEDIHWYRGERFKIDRNTYEYLSEIFSNYYSKRENASRAIHDAVLKQESIECAQKLGVKN